LFKLTTPTTWWLIPPRRDYYRLSYRGKLTPKDFVHLFKLTTPTTWWLIPPEAGLLPVELPGNYYYSLHENIEENNGENFSRGINPSAGG
jgi:hypothetical protein